MKTFTEAFNDNKDSIKEAFNDNKDSIKEAFKIGKDFKQRNNITVDDFCEYHNTSYEVNHETDEISIKYSREMQKIKEDLLSENKEEILSKDLLQYADNYDIKVVYINNLGKQTYAGNYLGIHIKLFIGTKQAGLLIIRYNRIYIFCTIKNEQNNIINTSLKILNHIFN